MFACRRCDIKTIKNITSSYINWISNRNLSAKQTAIALRPFYFSVHPDFFGQHPQEKSVNEESLKVLHEHLTLQRNVDRVKPAQVVFYIRSQFNQSTELKQVKIVLSTTSVLSTVEKVLQQSGLSLNYINTVKQTTHRTPFTRRSQSRPWSASENVGKGFFEEELIRQQQRAVELTLRSWLLKNIEEIRSSEKTSAVIQNDTDQLKCKIIKEIGLVDLRWQSLWGISHFRGCLKGFHQLLKDHPQQIIDTLQGRVLVFGNNTGVSLLGEVVLSGGDVRTDWLTLLRSVGAYDGVLERLPFMEKELSHLLNGIQVVRRKRSSVITMANDYELQLNKLLNTLRRGRNVTSKWLGDKNLSHLEMLVEFESGPLLSTAGQFVIPASHPGSMIAEFIAQNMQQATSTLEQNARYITVEDKVILDCKQHLQLKDLSKDENITAQQMVKCCEKLVTEYWKLGVLLTNANLNISQYYCLMDDKISIPWNFKVEQ